MRKSLKVIQSRLINYNLTQKQLEKMALYLGLLNDWNSRHNLTAILDEQQQIEQHLADSLTLKHLIKGPQVIDVGSGAGLPGIPLAIVLPEVHFTLVDASQKRIFFLQHVIHRLSLKNTTAIHARIEQYQPNEKPDQVVSRAVCTLANLWEWTKHLHHTDLEVLAMKGMLSSEETESVKSKITQIIKSQHHQNKCIVVLGFETSK